MWATKNEEDTLCLWQGKPIKRKTRSFDNKIVYYWQGEYNGDGEEEEPYLVYEDLLPKLKFKDKPVEVELVIKKN